MLFDTYIREDIFQLHTVKGEPSYVLTLMTPLMTAKTKDIKPQDDMRLTRSHSTVFF